MARKKKPTCTCDHCPPTPNARTRRAMAQADLIVKARFTTIDELITSLENGEK